MVDKIDVKAIFGLYGCWYECCLKKTLSFMKISECIFTSNNARIGGICRFMHDHYIPGGYKQGVI